MKPSSPSRASMKRPVLYQLCRAGERFEVGDGPVPLANAPLLIGRGDPRRNDLADGKIFVDDPWMSTRHAQIGALERKGTDSATRQRDGVTSRYFIEDMGSTNGILVNGVPSKRAPLLHGDLIETGRTFWVYVEEPATEPLLSAPVELGGVSTWTPSFARQLDDLLPRLAGTDHVLIAGAEGTGKGFLARTIHVVSGRSGRLVHLDCRERKQKRLLVDLFGDDKHRGRLNDAHNGTLFLEHVDALPVDVQDRLLEAMRKGAYTARVVAALTHTVEQVLAENRMRQGLVDAFGPLVVRLPALQQRLPDLGLLLDDFLARARGAPAISRDACRAVLRHSFRQHTKAMARVIEAAATLAAIPDANVPGGVAGVIELVHLPTEVVGAEMLSQLLAGGLPASPEPTSELTPLSTGSDEDVLEQEPTDPLQARPTRKPGTPPQGVKAPQESFSQLPTDGEANAAVDPEVVAAALRAAHGNVSAAARALGRPRAMVLRWMREFGIDPRR